jgi:hypothetical protein
LHQIGGFAHVLISVTERSIAPLPSVSKGNGAANAASSSLVLRAQRRRPQISHA